MKFKLQSILVLTLAIAGTNSAWALHEDPPEGAEFKLERSQEQVAQEQAYQGRVDASGVVPIRTEEQANLENRKDDSAKGALSAADRMAQGAKNLQAAEAALKNKSEKRGGSPWWFFALLAGVGLMAYVSIKDWMSKNIPDMPGKRR
ncbi:MAG: hypothetical protein JNK63_07210 [Chthonomonas sp.]|nr:hypothetical protein [Chthonomonas sp.]